MNTMSDILVVKKQELIMIDTNNLNEMFLKFNNVVSVKLIFDYIYEYYNCEIVLSEDIYEENGNKLYLEFINISEFNLKDFKSKFNQFFDMFVAKEENNLDGIKYIVSQYENDDISLKCFDVKYFVD